MWTKMRLRCVSLHWLCSYGCNATRLTYSILCILLWSTYGTVVEADTARELDLHDTFLTMTQLLLKVESVAVDGEFILKHAAKAALAAQKHTVSPESSDSGLDDRAPVGTVTRVLRAFRAVSTPAAASKKKDKKKHKTTEDPGKYAGGQCDTDPTSKGSQQQSDQGAHNSSAAGFKDGSGTRRSVAEEVALSEEERRARKKAKKLRQKEQRKDDAEHAAKEKAKREKKKARAKAAKQAREHSGCALAE